MAVASAVTAVFATIALGGVLRRVRLLTAHADETLLKLIVRVLIPALILHTLVGNPRMMTASALVIPPLVGFLTVVGGMAIGYLVGRLLRTRVGLGSDASLRTFAVGIGLYNYGYVPLPLVEKLFDVGEPVKATLGVLLVHNLGVEVAIWTVGVAVVTGHLGAGWWKRIWNGPVVAIVVAMIINFSGLWQVWPDFLQLMIDMLARTAIPLSLLLTGAMIADAWGASRLLAGVPVIALACGLRLLLIPAMFVALAWALPVSIELKRVIVIQAAMPSAVFPIVLARIYGGDVGTAVRTCIGTSLVGLATLPIWLGVGLWVIGP